MTARLRVDPVACDGIGLCALAAPGLVGLDRWGYPVLGPPGDDAAARRAVRACPRAALWLEPVRDAASVLTGGAGAVPAHGAVSARDAGAGGRP